MKDKGDVYNRSINDKVIIYATKNIDIYGDSNDGTRHYDNKKNSNTSNDVT